MEDRPKETKRIALIVLGLLVLAGALAGGALLLGLGKSDDVDVGSVAASATSDASPGSGDPLAWDAGKRAQFEQRATLGLSHVLYEKSPDGIVASAERTARWRKLVDAAATRHGVDADALEAVILLESAGRPDAMAGPTPDSAVGLAQILPSTATDLLGMKVDLTSSDALTEQIAKAGQVKDKPKTKRKNEAALARKQIPKLVKQRRAIDQRYQASPSIEGAAKYLEIAGKYFGDPQLAVVSYHMGIGNLDDVIGDYTGEATGEGKTAQLVDKDGLSYAQIFFDTSPTRNVKAWNLLASFGDDSSTYLWRVLSAAQAMKLYRSNPDKLDALNSLETAKATLEEVYHPEGSAEIFADGDAITNALGRGELVKLPDDKSLGFEIDKQMGELAPKLGRSPQLYRALRPEALAAWTYIGAKVKAISGEKRPLKVTSSVRDREYQDLLIGVNGEATKDYSLHTTGYSFDILRRYGSNKQADAFQFVLDRMRALGLLDYAYEPAAIHITVSSNAKELIDG
ncbi:hypothetical protein BH10ACT11_BH10ACT11_01750 [soil metagenome]